MPVESIITIVAYSFAAMRIVMIILVNAQEETFCIGFSHRRYIALFSRDAIVVINHAAHGLVNAIMPIVIIPL